MATRIAWWISVGSLFALAWLSRPTRHSSGHLSQAEQAFAAGHYRLAARLLRQVEPRELPKVMVPRFAGVWRNSSGKPALGSREGRFSPDDWVSYDLTFPTSADCLRPALAAAEYCAGRPARAREVMGGERIRQAGSAWPEGAESMPRARVLRYLLGVGERPRTGGAPVWTLNALMAREIVRLEPNSVADRLAFARSIHGGPNDSLLPLAAEAFEEVLKLDPSNKDALLATGRIVEAYRHYPDDPDVRRRMLKSEASPAKREKVLQEIVRLDPKASLFELQTLVKQAIAAGDFPKALRYLQAAHRYPKRSWATTYYFMKRGWILAETGRFKEALASYAEAEKVMGYGWWQGQALPDYQALAYLQARDIRRAREAFLCPYTEEDSPLRDLFAAWCSDKIKPSGELEGCLAKQGRIRTWQMRIRGDNEDDFTRQAARILKEYPDCLPAAVLLAGALHDHHDRASDADVEKGIRDALAPFAGRFPKEIAELQPRLLHWPGSTRRPPVQ